MSERPDAITANEANKPLLDEIHKVLDFYGSIYGSDQMPKMLRFDPFTLRVFEQFAEPPRMIPLLEPIPPDTRHWDRHPSWGRPQIWYSDYGRIVIVSDRDLPRGRWVVDYCPFDLPQRGGSLLR